MCLSVQAHPSVVPIFSFLQDNGVKSNERRLKVVMRRPSDVRRIPSPLLNVIQKNSMKLCGKEGKEHSREQVSWVSKNIYISFSDLEFFFFLYQKY